MNAPFARPPNEASAATCQGEHAETNETFGARPRARNPVLVAPRVLRSSGGVRGTWPAVLDQHEPRKVTRVARVDRHDHPRAEPQIREHVEHLVIGDRGASGPVEVVRAEDLVTSVRLVNIRGRHPDAMTAEVEVPAISGSERVDEIRQRDDEILLGRVDIREDRDVIRLHAPLVDEGLLHVNDVVDATLEVRLLGVVVDPNQKCFVHGVPRHLEVGLRPTWE